jgi:hypothetical protein
MKTYQLTNPVPVSSESDIANQFKAETRLKAAQKAFRALSKRIKKSTDDKNSTSFYFSLAKVDGDGEINAKESYHFEGCKTYTTKGTAKLTVKCFTPKKVDVAHKITVGPSKYNIQKGGDTDSKKKKSGLFPLLDPFCFPYDPFAPYVLSANNYLFYNPLWYGDIYYSSSFFNGYPFLGLMYPFDFPMHYTIGS